MGKFENLRVWQKGVELSVKIYKLAREEKLSKDYGLKDQMQRSSVSIPSNIAEGDELNTQKQSINFLFHAKGSCAELYTQIVIAEKADLIPLDKATILKDECKVISAMLGKLIKIRNTLK